jgi:hypothetical protein
MPQVTPQAAPEPKRRRTRAASKPFWERGYKCHGYWLGKLRIGVVEVEPGEQLEMKYRWSAGTHAGQTTTLKEAKQLVEETILMGGHQLALFDDTPLILSPTR